MDLRVKWCPGHCGVAGNERADEFAKAGTALPPDADLSPTAYGLRTVARKRPHGHSGRRTSRRITANDSLDTGPRARGNFVSYQGRRYIDGSRYARDTVAMLDTIAGLTMMMQR